MCSSKKDASKREKENNKTKIMLTDITRGLYHAGATVNGMLADQYVKLLENFFVYDQSDDSYTAKTMKLNLPDEKVVEVPLISMVSPKGLMIDKMKVNMSLNIMDTIQRKVYDPTIRQINCVGEDDETLELTRASFQVKFANSLSDKIKRKDSINIEIDFKSNEPPEGFMMILDEFYQKMSAQNDAIGPNVEVDEVTSSSIKLAWKKQVNEFGDYLDVSGYYLDVSGDEFFNKYLEGYNKKDIGLVEDFTIDDLEPATMYFVRVRAYNKNGEGPMSPKAYAKTMKQQ